MQSALKHFGGQSNLRFDAVADVGQRFERQMAAFGVGGRAGRRIDLHQGYVRALFFQFRQPPQVLVNFLLGRFHPRDQGKEALDDHRPLVANHKDVLHDLLEGHSAVVDAIHVQLACRLQT